MTSFYGYNVHAQGLRNPTDLIAHVIKTKPRWLLTMDGLALAQQLKAASPDTNVIHRNYAATKGDDDVFKRFTPQQWLDAHKADIDAGVWLMTTCEAGWSQELLDWHVALMKLCIPKKVKLVIGNWSVGTPEPALIPMGRAVFQLCADNPQQFVIGLHEYAGGVITSGFTGGAPDGWTQAHDKQYHPDYQRQASWPLNGELKLITKFHCGRYQFIEQYCKSVGMNSPQFVLTEFAFDSLSDIGWWLSGLPKTAPYSVISGFKTLQNYWKQIFPQWSHDQAFFKQCEYAANNIYADSPVQGALFFCYGHIDPKWEADDLEGHTEFLGYLEAYAVASRQLMQPNYPTNFVANSKYALSIAGSYRNLRDRAGLQTGITIGQVDNGETITALEQVIKEGNYWWKLQKDDGKVGYVSLDGGNVKFIRLADIPLPPPIVVIPTPTPPPVISQSSYLLSASDRAKLLSMIAEENERRAAWLLEFTNLITSLQETTVAKAA